MMKPLRIFPFSDFKLAANGTIFSIGPSMRSNNQPHSVRFNLVEFSKRGDVRLLPALAEGDVIYVPHNNEDFRKQLSDLIRDLANLAVLARFA